MEKFDLKKMIAENKATFFSSLNESDLMKNIGKGLEYEATEEMIRDYASGLFGDTYEPEDLADFYLQNPSAFPKSLDHEFFKNNYDDILSLAMTGLGEGKEEGETIEKNKMKKSELKTKIKEMIVAEMNIDVTDETGAYDFLAELEGMLEQEEEEEIEDKIEVDVKEPTPDKGGIDVTQNASADLTGIEKQVQDNLEAAMEAAKKLNDEKLQQQIGNSLTFFTRQHVVKENKEALNEDLTSTITILLAFLIGIPAIPVAGALMFGLVDYIFNGLPDQYREYKSLKSYKGSDKQEEILALAKEIESKLSPGKKRYLKTLVNRIGVAKLEDKAREYRALDRYASGEKSQMDDMNENLNADIEAALKDLPVPTDMAEGKKEDLNESMFPMLNKILK